MLFSEPSTQMKLPQQNGVDYYILIIELLCILFELSYFGIHIYISYTIGLWSGTMIQAIDNKEGNETSSSNKTRRFSNYSKSSSFNILSNPKQSINDMFVLIIMSLLTINWILMSSQQYSFEYYLPIRPLLIIVANKRVYKGVKSFFYFMVS